MANMENFDASSTPDTNDVSEQVLAHYTEANLDSHDHGDRKLVKEEEDPKMPEKLNVLTITQRMDAMHPGANEKRLADMKARARLDIANARAEAMKAAGKPNDEEGLKMAA